MVWVPEGDQGGERAGAIGVGTIEEEGEPAVVGVDNIGGAGVEDGGVEAKDGVGAGDPGR